jgi:hypothetical protein
MSSDRRPIVVPGRVAGGRVRARGDRMTERKHLKRLVRARAAKTGESYAAALRHVRSRQTEEIMPTTGRTPAAELVQCSFCGKTQNKVSKIIAGPGVYICNECIDLSNVILSEEAWTEPSTEPPSADMLLTRLTGTATTLGSVEADMRRGVAAARSRQLSWDAIGRAIGLSPQDAEERFGLDA